MRVAINESTLTAIGDAIREKTDTTDLLAPGAMPAAIRSITTGTGEGYDGYIIFDNQTGEYMFGEGAWDKFIEQYGNQIIVSNITNAGYMFEKSNLTSIPFTIGLNANSLQYMFQNSKIEEMPDISFNTNNIDHINMAFMFNGCENLREADFSTFPKDIPFSAHSYYGNEKIFQNCYSLKKINDFTMKFDYFGGSEGLVDYGCFKFTFSGCYCLDSINDLFPPSRAFSKGDGCFNGCFGGLQRLKSFTFALDNGNAYERRWSGISIYLSDKAGYGSKCGNYMDITDKKVIDQETYDMYKDDPDYYTELVEYSRYNKDSAFETIVSLPDTSDYVSNREVNTISFEGEAGSATDGGAINTLNDAQIAIAAAKGWTVSFT